MKTQTIFGSLLISLFSLVASLAGYVFINTLLYEYVTLTIIPIFIVFIVFSSMALILLILLLQELLSNNINKNILQTLQDNNKINSNIVMGNQELINICKDILTNGSKIIERTHELNNSKIIKPIVESDKPLEVISNKHKPAPKKRDTPKP